MLPTEGGGPWGNPLVENEGLNPGGTGPAENGATELLAGGGTFGGGPEGGIGRGGIPPYVPGGGRHPTGGPN